MADYERAKPVPFGFLIYRGNDCPLDILNLLPGLAAVSAPKEGPPPANNDPVLVVPKGYGAVPGKRRDLDGHESLALRSQDCTVGAHDPQGIVHALDLKQKVNNP